MPRKPTLLPYLQTLPSGRLRYVRRVPPDLREFLGNRRYITVLMPNNARESTDKRLIKAWNEATTQVEADIAAARAEQQAKSLGAQQVSALSPKDAAGIAAEPWRKLLNAGDQGQITTDIEDMLAEVVLIALEAKAQAGKPGAMEQIEAAKVAITQRMVGETLEKLQIQPDSQVMRQIQQRLLGYVPMFGADERKRAAGDFSPGDIETKPPPLPKAKVTYAQLIDEWVRDAGGIRELDGVGVGQKQVDQYRAHITELIQVTQLHYPDELDIDTARQYLTHIQLSKLATATKQTRLVTVSNLFAIGVRVGLLNQNPFAGLRIKRPKGERGKGYRPFTREELVVIFKEINRMAPNQKNIVPLILLMTGARLGDIIFLRHQDVQQTKKGTWFFEMVDEPKDEYPRTLKGGSEDERMTPLHPLLVERGVLQMVEADKPGYVFENRSNESLSAWFKRLLQKTEIYEYRRTGLHSLRATAIDVWRAARLPEDVRRALTGHSSKDVQDRTYGEGLQRMPDILHAELSRVDWSWLP